MKTKPSGDVQIESTINVNQIQPSFQLEFGNIALDLMNKEKDKTPSTQDVMEVVEDEEEVDLDDEASASMRQILANELGMQNS